MDLQKLKDDLATHYAMLICRNKPERVVEQVSNMVRTLDYRDASYIASMVDDLNEQWDETKLICEDLIRLFSFGGIPSEPYLSEISELFYDAIDSFEKLRKKIDQEIRNVKGN